MFGVFSMLLIQVVVRHDFALFRCWESFVAKETSLFIQRYTESVFMNVMLTVTFKLLQYTRAKQGAVFIALSCIPFLTVIGNASVIIAVFRFRHLRRISNYYIVSLAVADLLVAVVVMIPAIVYETTGCWYFGYFCKLWIGFDIMCSTASVIQLCVLAVDRYSLIRDPFHYFDAMTKFKAYLIIASVWILSAAVSTTTVLLGLLGIGPSGDSDDHDGASEAISGQNSSKGQHNAQTPTQKNAKPALLDTENIPTTPPTTDPETCHSCLLVLSFYAAFLSSCVSFYIPCLIMLVSYTRLYLLVRRILRSHNIAPDSRKADGKNSKAVFTLGIVTGTFLVCWVPFFVINPLAAYNEEWVTPLTFLITTWLGYFNSCVNPIIYVLTDSDFRAAFHILFSCAAKGDIASQFSVAGISLGPCWSGGSLWSGSLKPQTSKGERRQNQQPGLVFPTRMSTLSSSDLESIAAAPSSSVSV